MISMTRIQTQTIVQEIGKLPTTSIFGVDMDQSKGPLLKEAVVVTVKLSGTKTKSFMVDSAGRLYSMTA